MGGLRRRHCWLTGTAIVTDVSASLGDAVPKKRKLQAENGKDDRQRKVRSESTGKAESRRRQRARIFDGVRKILRRAHPKPVQKMAELPQFFRTARGGVAQLRRDAGSAWCGKVFDADCQEWADCPAHLPPCKPCRRLVSRV